MSYLDILRAFAVAFIVTVGFFGSITLIRYALMLAQ
jgi:hypothetical protein